MVKDTLAYVIEKGINEQYDQDMVEWVENGSWEQEKPVLHWGKLDLVINGSIINHYVDYHELSRVTTQHQCYYSDYFDEVLYPKHEHSMFYPWTCTCGVPGCDSIWDGVHLKVRGHSVEWRIKKNMGYEGFISKRFFTFDKSQYFDIIAEIKREMDLIYG